MNLAKVSDRAECSVEKSLKGNEGLKVWTRWHWEHYRDGEKIDEWQNGNLCVNEGINHVLNVAFSGGTVNSTWYIAVFDNNYTPTSADTYGTPGFTENDQYTEANRPTWQEGGVSSKQITNSANKASFTFSTSATIYGAALLSNNTKSNTTNTAAILFCTSQFTSGSKTVASSDVLKVSITLSMADA
jgi:beta-glucanase (GH16 family)